MVSFPRVISALAGLRQPPGGAGRSTFPFDGPSGQSLQGNGGSWTCRRCGVGRRRRLGHEESPRRHPRGERADGIIAFGSDLTPDCNFRAAAFQPPVRRWPISPRYNITDGCRRWGPPVESVPEPRRGRGCLLRRCRADLWRAHDRRRPITCASLAECCDRLPRTTRICLPVACRSNGNGHQGRCELLGDLWSN
jgi:hypothetical protein